MNRRCAAGCNWAPFGRSTRLPVFMAWCVATGWLLPDLKSMVIPVATDEAWCKRAKVGRACRIAFLRPITQKILSNVLPVKFFGGLLRGSV